MLRPEDLQSAVSTYLTGDSSVTSAQTSALDAVLTFKSQIKKNAVRSRDVVGYCEALTDAFTGGSADLKAASVAALCYLAKRVLVSDQHAILPAIPSILPVLISGFDHPDVPTSSAELARRSVEDVWLAFPEQTNEYLRTIGLTHSRRGVRLVTLELVAGYIVSSKSRKEFLTFVPVLVRFLKDSDREIVDLSFKTLATYFSKGNPLVLARELRRQGVDRTIEERLLAVTSWDTEGSSLTTSASSPNTAVISARASASLTTPGPPSCSDASLQPTLAHAVSSNQTPRSAPSTSVELAKQLPDYGMQKLEPLAVDSIEDFHREIHAMQPAFEGKEQETNWKDRKDALLRFRRMLRGNVVDHPEDIVSGLKLLQEGIVKSIVSLRTMLVADACFLVKDAAQTLGIYLNGIVEPFLSACSKLCSGSKKITAAYGHTTFCALVLCTAVPARYLAQISAVMRGRVSLARANAMAWLDLTLTVHGDQMNLDSEVEECIHMGLTDAAPGVRTAARPAFWTYASQSPQAELLMARLDPAQQKALEKARPVSFTREPEPIELKESKGNFESPNMCASVSVAPRYPPSQSENTSTEDELSRLDIGQPTQRAIVQENLPVLGSEQGVVRAPEPEDFDFGIGLCEPRIPEPPATTDNSRENDQTGSSRKAGSNDFSSPESETEITSRPPWPASGNPGERLSLTALLQGEEYELGLQCLQYTLRAQKIPEELCKNLEDESLPDPDTLGSALRRLFVPAGTTPGGSDLLVSFMLPELITLSLDYVPVQDVLWNLVHVYTFDGALVSFTVMQALVDKNELTRDLNKILCLNLDKSAGGLVDTLLMSLQSRTRSPPPTSDTSESQSSLSIGATGLPMDASIHTSNFHVSRSPAKATSTPLHVPLTKVPAFARIDSSLLDDFWDSFPETESESMQYIRNLISIPCKESFLRLSLLCSGDQQIRAAGRIWLRDSELSRMALSAALTYLEEDHQEGDLNVALLFLRKLAQSELQLSWQLVLDCLIHLAASASPRLLHDGISQTRDAIVQRDLNSDELMVYLVSNYGQAPAFVLETMTRLAPKCAALPASLPSLLQQALENDDVAVRKQVYALMQVVHQQQPQLLAEFQNSLAPGQRRILDHYLSTGS